MIDSSEKCNGWFKFEVQSPRVLEKHNNAVTVQHYLDTVTIVSKNRHACSLGLWYSYLENFY